MEDKIIDLIDETYLIQFVFCFHRRDFSIYFLCVWDFMILYKIFFLDSLIWLWKLK
jgi:hypothetical protein